MARAGGDVRENDRKNAVTRFCLAMEEHRRTEAGRVRTAREMVDFFFPRAQGTAEDRIFRHIPPEVRGPIVSGWGVRGAKSAVRDDDEKIRHVVCDALAAGDIDEAMFEEGVAAQILIDWAPLPEWWTFWRTGKLTGVAIQKALAVARELALFDDRWFLQNVEGRGGKLKGTDTLCDTLSKDQIVAWLRKVHESGDGSPAGLVNALGWETILSKTSQEALLFALDALARKIGLVPTATATATATAATAATSTVTTASGGPAAPTEMPRGDDENIAIPQIPGLATPKLDDPASLAEARAAMLSTLGNDTSASADWVPRGPAPSGTMLTADEAPISFREIEPAEEKVKMQPPPMPPTRKGLF